MGSVNLPDNSFAGRVQKLIGKLGSKEKLAKSCQVSATMISKYAEGKSEPARDKLIAMAEGTGTSLIWLATGNGPMEVGHMVVSHPDADHVDNLGQVLTVKEHNAVHKYPHHGKADEFVLVPRYEVAASAGGGAVIHSEQIVDYLSFKSEWIRNGLGLSEKDLALINVKGDSMEPTLSNEDLILVDLRTRKVEDNSVYVLQFNGTLLVKRIQRKLDGSVVVSSDNKMYTPESVRGELLESLNVVGRVVWCGRKM